MVCTSYTYLLCVIYVRFIYVPSLGGCLANNNFYICHKNHCSHDSGLIMADIAKIELHTNCEQVVAVFVRTSSQQLGLNSAITQHTHTTDAETHNDTTTTTTTTTTKHTHTPHQQKSHHHTKKRARGYYRY
jgi:hypothetical protein